MYTIILFTESNEVEVVPSSWLITPTSCYWPPFRSQKITNMCKLLTPADYSWEKFQVRKLVEAANYRAARIKLRRSTISSDLSSDSEMERKKRKPERFLDDYDDDELLEIDAASTYNLPSPPKASSTTHLHEIEEAINGTREVARLQVFGKKSTPSFNTNISSPSNSILSSFRTTSSSQSKPSQFSRNPTMDNLRPQLPCHCEKKLDEIQRTLRFIVANQNKQNELLQLITEGGIGNDTASNLHEEFNLPLSSIEELFDFNSKYKADNNYRQRIVSHLSSFGGNSLASTTTRILRELFSDELGTKISWTGLTRDGTSKPGLSTLEFHQTIFRKISKYRHYDRKRNFYHDTYKYLADSIRNSKKFKDVQVSEITRVIQTWIYKSAERLNTKLKKISEEQPIPESNDFPNV